MAIKHLKGVRGIGTQTLTTTRPTGFKFPVGIKNSGILGGPSINSAVCATTSTVDMLIVGGGGAGGPKPGQQSAGAGGGGGGGGFRLLTANTFTSESPAFANTAFIVGDLQTYPIVVGTSSSASCAFGFYCSAGGGPGGTGGYSPGNPGGSGGGGASGNICGSRPGRPGGAGIAGQGFCGGCGGPGPGLGCIKTDGGGGGGAGACSTNQTEAPGVGSSFTGAPVTYSAGGPRIISAGPANSGRGGGGGNCWEQGGGAGGSGIVAVRYINNQQPTTPVFSGGDCICCTGGCIIHIFCSSGFINVGAAFSIN